MRDNDPDIVAALAAAPVDGLAARHFIWITARKRADGSTGTFGFWTDRLPVTIAVQKGDGTESRTYQADGAVISVDKITLSADTDVRRWSCTLSMLHPTVRELYGDYVIKLAAIEVHRGPLDLVGYRPIGVPRRRFRGYIDQAGWTRPQPGSEGGLKLTCISASAELSNVVNPALRDDETTKLRTGTAAPNGDRHSQYAGVVGGWQLVWGGKS